MTMMMNTVSQSAAAAPKNADAKPAQATSDAGAGAQPNASTQAGASAQPFAAWLGNQAQAAARAAQAGRPDDGAASDIAAGKGKDAAAPDGPADDTAATSAPQDGALLAAMAMPLMPLTPAQVAQAVQAAQPSAARGDGDATPAADTPAVAGVPGHGIAGDGGRHAATLDRGPALPPAADGASAQAARPAQADAAPSTRFAVHAQANAAAANTGTQDGGADHAGNGAPAAPLAGAIPAQPAANAPAADTVKLAGPPTAWRQSLQEALGERLNVQVGKNMEQAVIRLEPPQLGRIDIAIRHSAGMLEVNISATNGEVLRQLQTVSDNLRSDLSQRQFTEVAVTVAPAPKNGAAPFGDPQQGRGRQQGREQEDQEPGRALAEASNNPSAFSLGGRD
ncbi:flagellar hook-length control protein FliK [Massilia sp. LXY-6]|uniref:flagellar hook-length control protein FliK n=1 Tax=Massilia sp. LXY-6 TaxID=3379823 RepID=UPI003EE10275